MFCAGEISAFAWWADSARMPEPVGILPSLFAIAKLWQGQDFELGTA